MRYLTSAAGPPSAAYGGTSLQGRAAVCRARTGQRRVRRQLCHRGGTPAKLVGCVHPTTRGLHYLYGCLRHSRKRHYAPRFEGCGGCFGAILMFRISMLHIRIGMFRRFFRMCEYTVALVRRKRHDAPRVLFTMFDGGFFQRDLSARPRRVAVRAGWAESCGWRPLPREGSSIR